MGKTIEFNKEAVKKFLKEDSLISFRYELLRDLENKEEDEALKIVFERMIMDDELRMKDYYRLLKSTR